MTMGNLETAIIVATIAFIANIVATITNIIIAIMNNKRLKLIEKEKHIHELITYRYTKLYSILENVENEHGFTSYPNDPSRTLKEALDKRRKFIAFYKLSR